MHHNNEIRSAMSAPAVEIIVPIAFFATVFGIIYLAVSARHRQRMAMIEKGVSPSEFMEKPDPYRSLKLGMVAVGVGLGLLFGYLFQTYVMQDAEDDPLPYFVMVSLFAGAAMIGHYFIVQRKQRG